MPTDISHFIKGCHICAWAKAPFTNRVGTLGSVVLQARDIHDIWMVDYAGPFTAGFKYYVLLFLDCKSRFLIAEAVRSLSAETYLATLHEKIILPLGIPSRIHSDRGRSFISKALKDLHSTHIGTESIQYTYGFTEESRNQGFVENSIKQLKISLETCLAQCKRDKDFFAVLNLVVTLHNHNPHRSTGVSPYRYIHGREPVTVLNHFFQQAPEFANNPDLLNRAQTIRSVHDQLYRASILQNQASYNAKARPTQICEGQQVYRKRKNGHSGPHTVLRKHGSNSWVIRTASGVEDYAPETQLHPVHPTTLYDGLPDQTVGVHMD
jgi:hypothetical protein